ncbi:MAG: S46 family peptidase [Bacteroidetes bacterium]|nr:S46 family peptidase [Bacteroidota bacterium]
MAELLKTRNYGPYADADLNSLVTCFITTNEQGNSEAPVINGNGELIGCAFDGEAMSGDVAFDQRFKHTCADIRYTLWVVDKVLDGRRPMDEMTLRY